MNQKGMTLIELVLSFALLGMVLTAIVLGLSVGIWGTERLDRQTTAAQLARSQIEYILSQPYNSTYPLLSPPQGWELNLKITELSPQLLQEVTVEVGFEGKTVLSLSVYKANSKYSP